MNAVEQILNPIGRFIRRRLVIVASVLLLCAFALLELSLAQDTSPTFDEPTLIACGYEYVSHWWHPVGDDSTINLRLSQMWTALPLLAMSPKFPSHQDMASTGSVSIGEAFVFHRLNDPEAIMLASRVMVIILSIVLGALVFICSRRLHGGAAGLVSLALYCLCPMVIANSALATTDIPTTLFFTLSVLSIWAMLHRVSVLSVVLAGVATGALLASKITGLLIVPIALVLLVVRIIGRRPVTIKLLRQRECAVTLRSCLLLLGAGLISAILAWSVIWAVYGFQYATTAQPRTEAWDTPPNVKAVLAPMLIAFARARHLLPEAYLFDLHQFVISGSSREAFLLGHYALDGWWYYFPVALLTKNPIPLLLSIALAIFIAWHLRRRSPCEGGADYYGLVPLGVMAAIYGAAALTSHLNIGARHVLPLYPFMMIFAGLIVRLPIRRLAIRTSIVSLLLAWSVAEAVIVHPHYLAYFNELVGGSSNGYRVMVDSSYEWGQDLPYVQRWMNHRLTKTYEPICFAYFGSSNLRHYGVDENSAVLLPQFFETRPVDPYDLKPGTYLISATLLQSLYIGTFMGPWRQTYESAYNDLKHDVGQLNTEARRQSMTMAGLLAQMPQAEMQKWLRLYRVYDYARFCRLCAYLRHRNPDERITYGMFVYELSDQELHTALDGPTPEISDPDVIKGWNKDTGILK